jgi:hypothetical protein
LEVFGEAAGNSLLLRFQINKVQAFSRGHVASSIRQV